MKKKVQFKTYNQLLDNLREHGLNITNNGIAKEILKSRGYYNLVNRYKNILYEKNKNVYKINSSLVEMYLYSRMEDDLKNILFRFTINFEQEIKESMSYIMSRELGIDPKNYLNPKKYRSHRYSRTVSILSQIKEISKTKNNPTRYYRENYECIPPWILLNNVMFGQMRMLYGIFPNKMKRYVIKQILLPPKFDEDQTWEFESKAIPQSTWKQIDKEQLEKHLQYGPIYKKARLQAENDIVELFQTMLKIINSFRNTLAHGGSISNFKAYQFLKLKYVRYFFSKGFTNNEFIKNDFGNGIFGVLIILLMSLDRFDAIFLIQKLEDWEKRNTQNIDQQRTFNTFIKNCGLPTDFIDRLKEMRNELYTIPRFDFPDLFKF